MEVMKRAVRDVRTTWLMSRITGENVGREPKLVEEFFLLQFVHVDSVFEVLIVLRVFSRYLAGLEARVLQ